MAEYYYIESLERNISTAIYGPHLIYIFIKWRSQSDPLLNIKLCTSTSNLSLNCSPFILLQPRANHVFIVRV